MDSELIEHLTSAANARSGLRVLTPADAERVRIAVASRFGFDPEKVWWWTSEGSRGQARRYEGSDGLGELRRALAEMEAPLYLVATDDSGPPWLCIEGTAEALIELVGETRFFEYFVVDRELTQVVFDTHHNTLVLFGQTAGAPTGDAT